MKDALKLAEELDGFAKDDRTVILSPAYVRQVAETIRSYVPSTPPGWKLVPIEPTHEMAHLLNYPTIRPPLREPDVRLIWKCMLEAAPTCEGETAR